MEIAQTKIQDIMSTDQRRKARIISKPVGPILRSWLFRGWRDFKTQPFASGIYGLVLVLVSWAVLYDLFANDLGWMILPVIAGTMMLGPMTTVGLYRMSRRAQGLGGQALLRLDSYRFLVR